MTRSPPPCPHCLTGRLLQDDDGRGGWETACLQCGWVRPPAHPLPFIRDDSARLPRDGGLRGSKVPRSWHPAPAVRAAQRRRKQGL